MGRRERRGSSLIGHAASWDLNLRKCNMHQQVMVVQQQGRKKQGEIFYAEIALVMMLSVCIQMNSSIDHSFPLSHFFFFFPKILKAPFFHIYNSLVCPLDHTCN